MVVVGRGQYAECKMRDLTRDATKRDTTTMTYDIWNREDIDSFTNGTDIYIKLHKAR